jgi:hypothetical protein
MGSRNGLRRVKNPDIHLLVTPEPRRLVAGGPVRLRARDVRRQGMRVRFVGLFVARGTPGSCAALPLAYGYFPTSSTMSCHGSCLPTRCCTLQRSAMAAGATATAACRSTAVGRRDFRWVACPATLSPKGKSRGGQRVPIHPLGIDGGHDTIQLRETLGNLSGSGSETHQHFAPADANCCQSLLLDPDATISIDLHKRLFLLVSR